MGKNTLRNPPQPRNQLPRTQSLSIYPTCVTIPVTCRRCLPSLAPPYPLKLPPNRHIMAYAKKHESKPPTTSESTPQNTTSLHTSNVRHHRQNPDRQKRDRQNRDRLNRADRSGTVKTRPSKPEKLQYVYYSILSILQ
jgi:hypothetical protein